MLRMKKKKQIYETATALFKRYGFDRVSIEEICSKADVSKMTFYKYFSNKKTLIKYIITELIDRSDQEYDAILSSNVSFDQKVRLLIEKKIKDTDITGQDFLRDYLQNKDPELRTFIEGRVKQMMFKVNRDFIEAQLAGNVRPDTKTEFLLYLMNHFIDMSKDETLISMYDTPQQLAVELINFYFYGILERPRK